MKVRLSMFACVAGKIIISLQERPNFGAKMIEMFLDRCGFPQDWGPHLSIVAAKDHPTPRHRPVRS